MERRGIGANIGRQLARQTERVRKDKLRTVVDVGRAWIGAVSSLTAAGVKITRDDDPTESGQAYARLVGFRLMAADKVVLLVLDDGSSVVLGEVDDGVSAITIPRDAVVIGDLDVQGVLTADQALFDENLGQEMTQEFQNAADPDGSTTDTVNYDDALDTTLVLGPGNYKILVFFSIMCIHSTSNSVHVRSMIDGTGGQARSVAVSSTIYHTILVAQNLTVAGNRTVTILGQYKSNTAGTTSAKAPILLAWADRVS